MPIGSERTENCDTEPGQHDAGTLIELPEYPVREYIAAMTREMSQMARWAGDYKLGCALDIAADIAATVAEPTRTRKTA